MYNIYVYYISGHYDQVKPHSSPWFSSACAAEEAFIDQFFAFTNDKLCVCKAMLRKATNCWKRVLEAAKLANANETRVHHLKTWLS